MYRILTCCRRCRNLRMFNLILAEKPGPQDYQGLPSCQHQGEGINYCAGILDIIHVIGQ